MDLIGYDLLDLTLQEDGSFGMDGAQLDENVFDDQGLGVAGLPGFDPDMQNPAPAPPPVRVDAGEAVFVDLTTNQKHATALLVGIGLGFLISRLR